MPAALHIGANFAEIDDESFAVSSLWNVLSDYEEPDPQDVFPKPSTKVDDYLVVANRYPYQTEQYWVTERCGHVPKEIASAVFREANRVSHGISDDTLKNRRNGLVLAGRNGTMTMSQAVQVYDEANHCLAWHSYGPPGGGAP